MQAKLGVPITTYNVVQGTKTPPGPGSAADYHIKVLILDSTWQIFAINFLCEKFCMFLWKNYLLFRLRLMNQRISTCT